MNLRYHFLSILFTGMTLLHAQEDPYLWLEKVEGEDALEWVESENTETLEFLQANTEYEEIYAKSLEILGSDERILYPRTRGNYIYNFWQDTAYPRGVWRRTLIENYQSGRVSEWEVLIDFKALGEAEGVNWVYKGVNFLSEEEPICMLSLSRGGGDAVAIREFNVDTKSFVEDGFSLPEAKGFVSWLDEETLLVGTDFGNGSMTTSGYPRIIKLWKRGTPLKKAKTVFEAQADDVRAFVSRPQPNRSDIQFITRSIDFFTYEVYIYDGNELTLLEIPNDVQPTLYQNMMLLELKSDWGPNGLVIDAGTLIGIDLDLFLKGERNFEIIAQPSDKQTITDVIPTSDALLVNMLDNVKGVLYEYIKEGDTWQVNQLKLPANGTIAILDASLERPDYGVIYTSFLQPTTLYRVPGPGEEPVEMAQLPAYFNADNLMVEQHEAISSDGTQVPYFVVRPRDLPFNGATPTILYGYGGFNVSLTPSYNALNGANWLEKGYVYVLANIRGGGELGPNWHKAALKENRQLAYNDFISVAQDLIERNITSPQFLGIRGGSNGGLLVGATMVQRPDLFNAVVCSVPLLDMKRYHKLLAGASWIGEYGNPDDPNQWNYIKAYSPYQNLTEGTSYPSPLFVTTTRDDRVHPGHARKMAAKMKGMGYDVFYFENTEGGHGAGVTHEQQAKFNTVIYAYLLSRLRQ